MNARTPMNHDHRIKVLVVDDEAAILSQLRWGLVDGFEVLTADNAGAALDILKHESPDVVAMDLALEDDDPETGFALLDRVLTLDPLLKVVMITGQDTKENALRAVEQGAFDFFTKPIDLDELRVLLKRAVTVRQLELENANLREKLRRSGSLGRLMGQSPEIQSVFRMIRKVSPTDVNVLLTGDSGTGKDLVAREIHRLSPRAHKPMVTVSCGSLPEKVLATELFGSPAETDGVGGKLRAAQGGTLFLDEVDEMPTALQARMTRFLEEQDLRGLGSKDKTFDVRLLVASGADLRDRVARGTFRDDFYFRLSVVSIHLPPLRDRKEDIVYLAQRFLERYAPEFGRSSLSFSREALRALQRFSWPGNVRELEHRVQRGIVLSRGRVIRPEDLELEGDEQVEVLTLREAREKGEREVVAEALRRNCGNIARAARDLEVSRPTLHDLLRKLSIQATDYKKGMGPRDEQVASPPSLS
jgi:two-component system NtrC family response regulator